MTRHTRLAARKETKTPFPVDVEALTITYVLYNKDYRETVDTFTDFFLLKNFAGEIYYSLVEETSYVSDDSERYRDEEAEDDETLSEEQYHYIKDIAQRELEHAASYVHSVADLNEVMSRYGATMEEYLGSIASTYQVKISKATCFMVKVSDQPSKAFDTLEHAWWYVADYYNDLASDQWDADLPIKLLRSSFTTVAEANAGVEQLMQSLEAIAGSAVPAAKIQHVRLPPQLLRRLEQEKLEPEGR